MAARLQEILRYEYRYDMETYPCLGHDTICDIAIELIYLLCVRLKVFHLKHEMISISMYNTAKWLLFRRRHFQKYFHQWNISYVDSQFIEICSFWYSWKSFSHLSLVKWHSNLINIGNTYWGHFVVWNKTEIVQYCWMYYIQYSTDCSMSREICTWCYCVLFCCDYEFVVDSRDISTSILQSCFTGTGKSHDYPSVSKQSPKDVGKTRQHQTSITHVNLGCITHWGRDEIDAILQMTFSNEFSWMKMYEFRLKFHWSLFPGVQFAPIRRQATVWTNDGKFTGAYMRHSASMR